MLLMLALVVTLVWIWSEFKSFLCRETENSDDFGLSTEETRKLGEFQRQEHAVTGSLARAANKVASLEQLGRGVRRTKSGSFDRRSKLGKKLSKEMPRARALELSYQNQLSEIQSEIGLLTFLPEFRTSEWVETEALRIANRLVLPVFAAVLVLDAFLEYPIANHWFVLGLSWFGLLFVLKKVQQFILMEKLGY
tara:strand:- start:62 stop:643 length:582 start_codon:yes stop_codon:yes gene_type:complete